MKEKHSEIADEKKTCMRLQSILQIHVYRQK